MSIYLYLYICICIYVCTYVDINIFKDTNGLTLNPSSTSIDWAPKRLGPAPHASPASAEHVPQSSSHGRAARRSPTRPCVQRPASEWMGADLVALLAALRENEV